MRVLGVRLHGEGRAQMAKDGGAPPCLTAGHGAMHYDLLDSDDDDAGLEE